MRISRWNENGQGKEENLPQRHFVHHKSYMTSPGPHRWEANN
jgi:hypothetical protein